MTHEKTQPAPERTEPIHGETDSAEGRGAAGDSVEGELGGGWTEAPMCAGSHDSRWPRRGGVGVAAGDNPPTTAPSGGSPSSPASSRAKVRPSRTPPHPLLQTRSQLPQSSLLTIYLRAPPCPPACGLVHVLASPLCLAGYELARPSESPGARATSPSLDEHGTKASSDICLRIVSSAADRAHRADQSGSGGSERADRIGWIGSGGSERRIGSGGSERADRMGRIGERADRIERIG